MIFKRLRERFKRKPTFVASLTEEQIMELRSLVTTPGYQTYLELIDDAIDYHAQLMLNNDNDVIVHRLRGLIQGLEFGPMLVDNIINKEDPQDERERQRHKLAEQRARSDASLYGTSHWLGRAG